MKRNLSIVGVIALIVALALGVVEAHYDTGIYLYGNDACTKQKDPMNLTFYTNATAPNSETHIVDHMGWPWIGGSTMHFWDHSGCRPVPDGTLGIQRASGDNLESRNHIRVRQGGDSDATWLVYSVAGAHFDKWDQSCHFGVGGHVGMQFDQKRDLIVANFQAAHGNALWANNNNTQTAQQCDGTWTGSVDGRTAWISIP